MDNTDLIITYCKDNNVSTTLLADALDKTGLVPFVYPLNKNQYDAGATHP